MAQTRHKPNRMDNARARMQRLQNTDDLFPVAPSETNTSNREDVTITLAHTASGRENLVPASTLRPAPTKADTGKQKYDTRSVYVPLEELRLSPTNTRIYIDEEKIDDLAASMRVYGMLQPMLVRPYKLERDTSVPWEVENKVKYEVIAGGRRYRAAQRAELAEAPVRILENADDLSSREIDLISNMHEQLSVTEKGQAVLNMKNEMQARLDIWLKEVEDHSKYASHLRKISSIPWEAIQKEFEETPTFIRQAVDRAQATKRMPTINWQDVAERVGMSTRQISYLIDAAQLPEDVADDLQEGKLSQRQVRAIGELSNLRIGDSKAEEEFRAVIQLVLSKEIRRKSLSGPAAEVLARQLREACRHLSLSRREQLELGTLIRQKNWGVASTLDHLYEVSGWRPTETPEDGGAAGSEATGGTGDGGDAQNLRTTVQISPTIPSTPVPTVPVVRTLQETISEATQLRTRTATLLGDLQRYRETYGSIHADDAPLVQRLKEELQLCITNSQQAEALLEM